jgi:Protein of unknown function (DUF1236)
MRKPLGKSLLASVAATALLAGIVAAEAQRGPEGGGDRSPAASSQSQQKQDRGGVKTSPSVPTPRATSGAGSTEERKGDRLDRGSTGQSGSSEIEKRTPQGAQQQDKPKPPQPSAAQERKGTTGAAQGQGQDSRQGERSKQRSGESQRPNERSTTGQTRTPDSERINRGDDRQNARERDSQRSRDQLPAAREERSGTTNTRDERSTTTNTREDRSSTSVRLNEEQRSRAVDVFSRQNVRSETNINVDVRVGARLPRSVRLNPVPREIVSINPRFRDYRYTVVRDEIVIINPSTYEVVEVIPRSGRGTTGRAPSGDRASSRVNISAEQRRMIRETVIKESSVPRCEDVRVTVGAEVSRSIRFSPFPEIVVREVPEIREYRYCMHADDVVLIDPDEYRIVEVID